MSAIHHDRDGSEVQDVPREKRRSSTRTDRDRDRDKDREHRHHHKPSRSSKTRPTDSDTQSSSHRRRRPKDKDKDKDRDRDREKRRDREKDREKDKDRDKDRDRDQDGDRDRDQDHGDDDKAPEANNDVVPELVSATRQSRPYSSFSKAHSKESIYSRDDLSAVAAEPAARRTDPLTPEATDLGADDKKRSKSADFSASRKVSTSSLKASAAERPPSPPETNLSEPKETAKEREGEKEVEGGKEVERKKERGDEKEKGKGKDSRAGTPTTSSARSRERAKEKDRDRDRDRDLDVSSERPRSRTAQSWVSRLTSKNDDKSKVSVKSRSSSQATFIQTPLKNPAVGSVQEDDQSLHVPKSFSPVSSASTSKRTTSGETVRPEPIEVNFSPESAQDSSPKTPKTATPQFPPPPPMFSHYEKPGVPQHLRFGDTIEIVSSDKGTPQSADFGPPPPPPPPPPLHIHEVPKVNYLTQNGGLPKPVSKFFLDVLPRQNGTRPSNPPLSGAETLFAPFFNLLDQYQTVLDSQCSIAVATGHKTIARRILDRLDNVFTRDLPADGCSCVVCERSDEPHHGLGWGEVLERYKGENPPWPPFDLAALGAKAADDSAADLPPRPDSPVKMDPDIAEEFRGHYLRQSKKVRAAVDKWLTSCAEAPAPAPQEVDDETLTFAILTNLDQEEQPFFNALLAGSRDLQPALRAPTPAPRKPRQDFLVRTGLALQRWYGLQQAPRDAETAVFLIKNKGMHDLLRTVGDINPSEWELLISGRFDGFLWSGADDNNNLGVPGGGPGAAAAAGGEELLTPTAEAPSRGATPGFFSPPPSQQQQHQLPTNFSQLLRGATMSPAAASNLNGPRVFSPPMMAHHALAASRGTTPFGALPYSRGATPASFVSGASSMAASTATGLGAGKTSVTLDEELEVQILAEVERNIYMGMEALEDAFETLHRRAEAVRDALRLRNAGLQMALHRSRVGAGAGAGMGHPGGGGGSNSLPSSGGGFVGPGGEFPRAGGAAAAAAFPYEDDYSAASESDWGGDDFGDIQPDDSASNISSSRHRRPKRRNERRTPAPIEEEDECR